MNGTQERRAEAGQTSRVDQFKSLVNKERQGLNSSSREAQSRFGPGLFEHLLVGYYLQNSKNDPANKFRIIGQSIGQRYFVIYTQMLDE